jgi:hypothetical protein
MLMDLKDVGSIRQKLVPPLVVLGLTDLVLGADLAYKLTLEPFDHNQVTCINSYWPCTACNAA